MINQPYIILDFETTGLSAHFDRAIEVGALKVWPNGKLERFVSFIKPDVSLSPTIIALTGITPADLENAPSSAAVFSMLADFVGELPIFAHNAAFDSKFFKQEMKRIGRSGDNLFICSLTLTRRLFPKLSAYNLEDLCLNFNIKNVQAHRALADVEATFGLLNKIFDQINQQSGRIELEIGFIQEILNTPPERIERVMSRELSLF